METVYSVEMKSLIKNCQACTSYGYYYCEDDHNLVNINGTKCYSDANDKKSSCLFFNFFSNSYSCPVTALKYSTSCDDFFGLYNMQYNYPHNGTITLPPRSSCGFNLQYYTSFINITHSFPVSLFSR